MKFDYIQSLYDDIIRMVRTIVIKRQDLADANETLDTLKAYEELESSLKRDMSIFNFNWSIKTLNRYVPIDKAIYYSNNPASIPTELRTQIIGETQDEVISSFEDKNEYYRMLCGLPETTDTVKDFIYIKNMEDKGIPTDVPIHKMTLDQYYILENAGVITNIKSKYKMKSYLDYIGPNKIDNLTARRAKPFEIIRLGTPRNFEVKEIFMKEYYGARKYILATSYNKDLFYSSPYYAPTIGMMMLMLAVRNTMAPTEDMYLSYEEIIDSILDSYGMLPYFKKMPFKYKRKMAIAMDRLLSIKGTDQVIVDLCNLFANDSFKAERYYLAKVPKRDMNGHIILPQNSDGTINTASLYELKFIRSDITNKDIDFTPESYVNYDAITGGDPLWQLTPEEENKFKSDDYNIMMSKYISSASAYELSALSYECNYFINILLENPDSFDSIKVSNSYSSTGYSNAFTTLITLLAAFAKRSGYDGNIVYDPEGVAEVYGFNIDDLDQTARKLQADIERENPGNPYSIGNKNVKDLSIDTLFQTRGVLLQFNYDPDVAELKRILNYYEIYDIDYNDLIPTKPRGKLSDQQLVNIYVTNTKIYKKILDEMKTTKDYKRYMALSQLKKILFTSAFTAENFRKSDGSLAETYLDLLEDSDPSIAVVIKNFDLEEDGEKLDNFILEMMEKMDQIFNSNELKFLFMSTPGTMGDVIGKYLKTAIEIFKASSVEFATTNIIFTYGDEVPVRIIDREVVKEKVCVDDDIYIDDDVAIKETIIYDDVVCVEPKLYVP